MPSEMLKVENSNAVHLEIVIENSNRTQYEFSSFFTLLNYLTIRKTLANKLK
jgi:hypothetical protein